MALPAILLLEDEEPFTGVAVGAEGATHGVMVAAAFSTGIPDLLSDPAYTGKMVCFAYPHVGTAGVVPDDLQSGGPAVRAVAGREIGRMTANRLGVEAMDKWLERNNVVAMEGLDTRAVVGILARRGLVRAVMGTGKFADAVSLRDRFAEPPAAWDIEAAGTARPYEWSEGAPDHPRRRVVVVDFGVKRGFLRRLAAAGCRVLVAPSGFPAEKILAEKPDAVVFSAGNGVPDTRPEAAPAAAELLGRVPLWGVGVGAGVLAAAAGANCVVNGRAHYGVHPVGRVGEPSAEMTVQAREFIIEAESLPGAGLAMTHFNLNDGSVAGFKCDERRVMGTLFHPESEPGPRDSLYLFEKFQTLLRK